MLTLGWPQRPRIIFAEETSVGIHRSCHNMPVNQYIEIEIEPIINLMFYIDPYSDGV